MSATLHSQRWHRVADLRPCLLPTLRLRRQRLRGEHWVLLSEPAGPRSVRLNAAGHGFAARLDGQHTLQQLWDALLAQDADPATQDELIDVLARLREAGLLQGARRMDFGPAAAAADAEPTARPRPPRSPLAWRVRLGDPTRLLDRLACLPPLLFSRSAMGLWLLAVAGLGVLAAQHAPALWAHGRQWLATPHYALLALLLYVPIKAVHELAHGLAVRRFGGQVPEAGVTLMLGLPVPYVDASAAAGFARRRQRVLVGAAGIMAELSLAAVALPLWLWLSPGTARDAAFVTLFITGVSTLLFNANPLQRLDGYFIATDALDLPNLAPRSRRWWLQALLHRVLRLPGVEALPVARGETPWLVAYAPLAYAYGVFMVALALLWLLQVSVALGVVLGLVLVGPVLLMPPWRLLRQLRDAAVVHGGTAQRWRRLSAAAVALLAAVLVVPLPQRMQLQAVVWPADAAQLRAAEEGFVAGIDSADGDTVQPGQRVLRLANPKLQAELARQQARVAALETGFVQAAGRSVAGSSSLSSSDGQTGNQRAELEAAQAELQRLADRVAALDIRARAPGRVALPGAVDLPGRFVRRGQLLGHLQTAAPTTLRAALPEADVARWRQAQHQLSVRLAATPGEEHAAVLLGPGGGAVTQLPSAALSARHGGSIATDPRDAEDLKALQPVVLLDLQLSGPPPAQPARLGERAWVTFDAGLASLGWQLAQALGRAVQRHLNPQL